MPAVPAVAIFDTAFHTTMPRSAYLYALPADLTERFSLRRYGFHGTSHHYVYLQAEAYLASRGVSPSQARVITCHLGNGCSITAIRAGLVQDTSMGFTPLEWLVMGTRSGDLDPAVVAYLCEKLEQSPAAVVTLLNKKSGLLGLSGVSSDMRDLLERAQAGDRRSAEAVQVFCYRVKKYIGAYTAVLGGLDALVFTAGIGENSPDIRERVCAGLEVLGVAVDPAANRCAQGFADISAQESPARILVIPTNEELMIAREALRVVQSRAG